MGSGSMGADASLNIDDIPPRCASVLYSLGSSMNLSLARAIS
jgi:hypothetical protein